MKSKPGIIRRVLPFTLIIYAVLVSFPRFFEATGAGQDDSWAYAINYLFSNHMTFGTEVIFPYGPLGFLLAPCYNLDLQIYVNIFSSILIILLLYIIHEGYCLLKYQYFIFFIVSFIVLLSLPQRLEYHIILFIGILCYLSLLERNRYLLFFIPIAIAISLYIKLTIFIPLISIYLITIIIAFIEHRHTLLNILSIISLLISIFVFTIICNMNFGALYEYISTSIQYSNSYSIIMSMPGNIIIFTMGMLVLVLYIIAALIFRKTEIFKLLIIFSISVFFAFKHGFVRQDAHVLRFFLFMLGIFATTFLAAKTRKHLIYASLFFITTLCFTLPIVIKNDSNFLMRVTCTSGTNNLFEVLNYNQSLEKYRLISDKNLEKDRLPEEWIKQIGKKSVDSIPSEIAYCPANNLTWSHNPLIQFVDAISADFDMISASHFQGPNSPDFIIAEFSSVDYRHIFTDVPMTWQMVIKNYEVAIEDLAHNRILLKRIPQPMEFAEVEVVEDHLQFNQKYELPNRDNLLISKIKLDLNAIGIITNTLFRIPPVMMDVQYQDGSIYTCRIVPNSFRNGVILNYFPSNISELSELIKKHNTKKVVGFEIYGDGCFYFLDNAEMSFSELTPVIP